MAKGMLPIAADGGARFPPLSSLPSTDARQADKHCRRAPPFPPGGNDDADDDQHVVLRPCAHEPIETLRDVHEAVFPIKFEDAFFEQLASGRFRTIGAYLPDNRLVGIAVWEVTSCWQADRYDGPLFSRVVGCGDSRDRHAVYIMTLGVRAGLRRQGIGRALLDACVSSARDTADCACVYLHVLASNSRAVRMYTGAQFLCLHTLPRFYPASTFIAPAAVDGIDADAHVFARYLRDGVPPASLRLLRSWRLACALPVDLLVLSRTSVLTHESSNVYHC